MKNKQLLFLLILSTSLLGYLSKELLNTEELVINSLAEKFTNEQIEEVLDLKEKWQWVEYIIIFFLLMFKVLIISALIDVGCFFFGKEIKVAS